MICYTIIRKGDDYGFKGLERTAGITDSSSERTEKKNTQKRIIIFLFSEVIFEKILNTEKVTLTWCSIAQTLKSVIGLLHFWRLFLKSSFHVIYFSISIPQMQPFFIRQLQEECL